MVAQAKIFDPPDPAWACSACAKGSLPWGPTELRGGTHDRLCPAGGDPGANRSLRAPCGVSGMTVGDHRIMLVDDHAIVREGYRSILAKQPGWQVVAEAGDGAEAYRLFKDSRPDLVIMDLTMPGIGGVEAIRRIRQRDRHARVLVFTMHQ